MRELCRDFEVGICFMCLRRRRREEFSGVGVEGGGEKLERWGRGVDLLIWRYFDFYLEWNGSGGGELSLWIDLV